MYQHCLPALTNNQRGPSAKLNRATSPSVKYRRQHGPRDGADLIYGMTGGEYEDSSSVYTAHCVLSVCIIICLCACICVSKDSMYDK